MFLLKLATGSVFSVKKNNNKKNKKKKYNRCVCGIVLLLLFYLYFVEFLKKIDVAVSSFHNYIIIRKKGNIMKDRIFELFRYLDFFHIY